MSLHCEQGYCRATNEVLNKELILDNHSAVLYDYSLIPEDQIRNDDDTK